MFRLTAGVFGHPSDVGGQALDVEVVSVKAGALSLPEVGRVGRTILPAAGLIPGSRNTRTVQTDRRDVAIYFFI